MKKKLVVIILALLLILGVGGYFLVKPKTPKVLSATPAEKEIIFYYKDSCRWCQKVKDEGTLEKLEALGVNIKKVDVAVGPVNHDFRGVPTFVIDDKVYSGYKTFDELKALVFPEGTSSQPSQSEILSDFKGEKGDKVVLVNGEIKFPEATFADTKVHFYNVEVNGKTIYFFVAKDKNGVYRVAANGCQVCFETNSGFRQERDEVVCNNCGNRYPLEKIATEKGGCSPTPINPDLEVKNGQVIVRETDLLKVVELF